MRHTSRWSRITTGLRAEWQHLTTINPSKRSWQMPLAAALATGLPLFIGAWFDHLDYGLVSSLGGLAFLYMPNTPLSHRMVWLMACGFGMASCFALGLMFHFVPVLLIWVLSFITMLVTMICRFYGMGPPGSLFFVMAAAIGGYAPGALLELPLKVGLLTLGAVLACLIGFFYSLSILRLAPAEPVVAAPKPNFDFVVLDSIVIGVFVGVALAVAQALQMERPYWVPVSCLAVIQGASLRAVWNRQLHRILGTALGLLLSWAILILPLEKWSVALIMMVLAFVIENAVVRHYGLAVTFITPLTILLAEASTLAHGSPNALIEARFFDTVLGCLIGLAGAVCLHSPGFRTLVGGWLRRFIPPRLKR